jgi:arginine decarboxylase
MVPSKVFFTKGVGRHKERLQSFEAALRDAGIAQCNLVTVSSILPPRCQIIPQKRGVQLIEGGAITFTVLARADTDESGRQIFASIGLAQPASRDQYGYLSEHHGYGATDEVAGEYAEDLAATMLATTLGIEFDPNKAWDEREQFFKMSGQFVRTSSVTQSALGSKSGLWTTVIAAAVFEDLECSEHMRRSSGCAHVPPLRS